jgi:pimeloyl-ACP methyl ester carboxylesterase
MKGWKRAALVTLAILLLALLVGPFLIPVPPLQDTLPPEQLADPDSLFVEVNGVQTHYKMTGSGVPALVLLHGFLASTFSWREVMAPLSKHGQVIAFDMPASGLTERPVRWEGENPYSPEGQAALTLGLMDALDVDEAILVGNSAGGRTAMLVALQHPERVRALVLISPATGDEGGGRDWIRPLLNTPQADRLGPLLVRSVQEWGLEFGRSAWHDPSLITPEIWEGYQKPLQAQDWDRGLWELMQARTNVELLGRLEALQLPVLVITGDDDRIVPTEDSLRLAGQLPQARLAVLPTCGHTPQEECPGEFLLAVEDFLQELDLSTR